MSKNNAPKILLLDIETFPMKSYHWGMFDQNITLEMVLENTTMASWAAKWYKKPKIYYDDVSKNKDLRKDKKICESLQKLINEADIIIGHNIKRFDSKKSNYRFLVNKLTPTKDTSVIDTLTIAKKHFSFDSNKLEHLANILDLEYKKLKHEKFSGNRLWTACLNKDKQAWKEMQHYNKYDVLVLESCYERLKPWDKTINFNVFTELSGPSCSSCGEFALVKWGYYYAKGSKHNRYKCSECGHPNKGKDNLLSKLKKSDMLK